ncbi:hypothetical protein TSAR_012181 [Trichomalopsis sarcophagae]|uniref:Uncharacterized protein n=1 Tax=Trichomalopsis sarcophagae TaxID=543379 RepID=A0A232EI21_9HYME|nr:hypothetical protein TSAR_012181 [Trichomalopsis sarcophagae]
MYSGDSRVEDASGDIFARIGEVDGWEVTVLRGKEDCLLLFAACNRQRMLQSITSVFDKSSKEKLFMLEILYSIPALARSGIIIFFLLLKKQIVLLLLNFYFQKIIRCTYFKSILTLTLAKDSENRTLDVLDNNTSESNWSIFKFLIKPMLTLSKRVLINESLAKYNPTNSNYKRFNLLNHINATITLKFSESFGYTNKFGEPQGSLKDVIFGSVSISLNIRFFRSHWKFQANSFCIDSLAIVTLKRQTTLMEKLGIFSLSIFTYSLIISLVFTVILKYIFEQSISLADLN